MALVYDGDRSITVLVEEIVVLVRLALLVIYRNRLEIRLIVDFCHQVVVVVILNILASLRLCLLVLDILHYQVAVLLKLFIEMYLRNLIATLIISHISHINILLKIP